MDWLRRGSTRRELKQRGRGIKGRVDKSMGIVTLIAEGLARSRPTKPLRLAKQNWYVKTDPRSRTPNLPKTKFFSYLNGLDYLPRKNNAVRLGVSSIFFLSRPQLHILFVETPTWCRIRPQLIFPQLYLKFLSTPPQTCRALRPSPPQLQPWNISSSVFYWHSKQISDPPLWLF